MFCIIMLATGTIAVRVFSDVFVEDLSCLAETDASIQNTNKPMKDASSSGVSASSLSRMRRSRPRVSFTM